MGLVCQTAQVIWHYGKGEIRKGCGVFGWRVIGGLGLQCVEGRSLNGRGKNRGILYGDPKGGGFGREEEGGGRYHNRFLRDEGTK